MTPTANERACAVHALALHRSMAVPAMTGACARFCYGRCSSSAHGRDARATNILQPMPPLFLTYLVAHEWVVSTRSGSCKPSRSPIGVVLLNLRSIMEKRWGYGRNFVANFVVSFVANFVDLLIPEPLMPQSRAESRKFRLKASRRPLASIDSTELTTRLTTKLLRSANHDGGKTEDDDEDENEWGG